jgi:four helix bundle protein
MEEKYHDKLKRLMDKYAFLSYKVTKKFPKEEIYGISSQLRRSSLSVILNYIEGFARRKKEDCKVYQNFMEISYGSLRESRYLLFFSLREGYLTKNEYDKIIIIGEEIGAMLYGIIK